MQFGHTSSLLFLITELVESTTEEPETSEPPEVDVTKDCPSPCVCHCSNSGGAYLDIASSHGYWIRHILQALPQEKGKERKVYDNTVLVVT